MLKESAPEPDFATFSQKSGDDWLTRSNCREARGAAKSMACRAFSQSDQKQHEALCWLLWQAMKNYQEGSKNIFNLYWATSTNTHIPVIILLQAPAGVPWKINLCFQLKTKLTLQKTTHESCWTLKVLGPNENHTLSVKCTITGWCWTPSFLWRHNPRNGVCVSGQCAIKKSKQLRLPQSGKNYSDSH